METLILPLKNKQITLIIFGIFQNVHKAVYNFNSKKQPTFIKYILIKTSKKSVILARLNKIVE